MHTSFNFIHYSIDDTIHVFKQLTEKQPNSIFDIDMFASLKKLHEKFGMVVSCYCFYQCEKFTLKDCTRSYKKEFESNSSWLRFGFHGYDGNEDYMVQNISLSITQYKQVMTNLVEIVGDVSIDKCPRIHTFRSSQNFISWMFSKSDFPIIGLLAADDCRLSYSLNGRQCKQLNATGELEFHGVKYWRTTQRFDSLTLRKILRLFTNLGGQQILFTHEWVFYPTSLKLRLKAFIIKKIMLVTAFYYTKRKYLPLFPMDKI